MSNVYSRDERASLDAFFDAVPRPLPHEPHVRAIADDDFQDDALLDRAHEVALIALNAVQGQLPQGSPDSHAGAVAGRRTEPPRESDVTLVSQKLCEIDWTERGGGGRQGFASPEAYRVTYLPIYDRFVVTASQDSPELYGVCDEAIGWFDAGFEVTHGAGLVVRHWWASKRAAGQPRWARLFGEGLFTAAEACDWADAIWVAAPEAIG